MSGNVRQWIVSGVGKHMSPRTGATKAANSPRAVQVSKAELMDLVKTTLDEADSVLA